jgi:metal-responsive CopG/Arc/MetJ family transcriptional regulator
MAAKGVNISLPEELLETIDRYATNLKRPRSSIIEEMARLGMPKFAKVWDARNDPSGKKVTASNPVTRARRRDLAMEESLGSGNNRTGAIIPALDLSRFRSKHNNGVGA